jgi:pimeloyl-ACP methyl ester carboxylesterase
LQIIRVKQKTERTPAAKRALLWALLIVLCVLPAGAMAQSKWQTLPETPQLPPLSQNETVPVNGAKVWYGTFGDEMRPVVTLLHGGGANSDYWAHLVRDLATHYRVIVIDSRGHGRSTFGGKALSYASMADDVIGVLNHLKIDKTAIVGWSDGANIGFYLTLNHPARISGHYAFAGNSNPGGLQAPPPNSAFQVFATRTPSEFKRLSPVQAEFAKINAALSTMWRTQPRLTHSDLQKISSPTWIVHAQHDEVIRQAHAKEIAASIPNTKFVLLKDVSHFALLQDAPQFNGSVQEFLRSLR